VIFEERGNAKEKPGLDGLGFFEGNSNNYEICYFVCHEAAKEMRVGPSKPACRSRLQTAKSCVG